MKIKNVREYMDSLKKLSPVIYYKGVRIDDVVANSATAPHVRSAAMTYALTNSNSYQDLATATSHLTGKKLN